MTWEDVPAYLTFARAAFGRHSHQAQAGYLRWLYDASGSATRGIGDAKVAAVGHSIVGCIHKLRYWLRIGSDREEIAIPHNLFVLEEHRRGAGLALITESFRDERRVFLMGVTPPVTTIYERMRCKPVASHWMRAVLNPFTAPVAFAASRLGPRVMARTRRFFVDTCHRAAGVLRMSADSSCFIRVALRANDLGQDEQHVCLDLDRDALGHRFLHADGPRHSFFSLPDERAAAAISIGFRRGLIVARIVETFASDERAVEELCHRLRWVLAAAGVNVLLAFTTREQRCAAFAAAGLTRVPSPPTSFMAHRRGATPFARIYADGGIGDFGFESVRLDAEVRG